MAKKKTVAEARYERERLAHMEIDQSSRFQEKTGLCPVCRAFPTAHGITCGRIQCITKWLNIKVGE